MMMIASSLVGIAGVALTGGLLTGGTEGRDLRSPVFCVGFLLFLWHQSRREGTHTDGEITRSSVPCYLSNLAPKSPTPPARRTRPSLQVIGPSKRPTSSLPAVLTQLPQEMSLLLSLPSPNTTAPLPSVAAAICPGPALQILTMVSQSIWEPWTR